MNRNVTTPEGAAPGSADTPASAWSVIGNQDRRSRCLSHTRGQRRTNDPLAPPMESVPNHFTDGARHTDPPDWVLLSSVIASAVPTFLWRFRPNVDGRELVHDLRNGLFTVRSGRSSFLAPALHDSLIRYDPGCMAPADGRAQRAASFFESKLTDAVPFFWDTPGLVLAIANRSVLHGRADASEETDRKLRRITLRVTSAPNRPSANSPFKSS